MELSIIDKWGKKRPAVRFNCEFCKKEVIKRIFKNRSNRFCSMNCAGSSKKIPVEIECMYCRSVFIARPSRIKKFNFCNRKCKEIFQSSEKHPNWKNGLRSYRNRCLREKGFICEMGENCLMKGIILPDFAFDVDHIDSNRDNNKINNLQVLCLLCHRKKTFRL